MALELAGTHPNLKEKLPGDAELTQQEVLASENPWCFDNTMSMEQRVQDGHKCHDGMKQLVDATNASFNQAHKRIDNLEKANKTMEKANKTKTKMTDLEQEGWSTGLAQGENLIGMTLIDRFTREEEVTLFGTDLDHGGKLRKDSFNLFL